jgi:hypothetical protein
VTISSLIPDDAVKLMTENTLLASNIIPQVPSLCGSYMMTVSLLRAFRELLLSCFVLHNLLPNYDVQQTQC